MLTLTALCTFPQVCSVLPKSIFFIAKSMSSSSKVIAEYAKSKRSSCKKCSQTIDEKTLRLGLVTRDSSRGFDMTKWHHLTCLPFDSTSIPSVESIGGFSSLKSADQEALKKLMEHRDQCEEKVTDGAKDTVKTGKEIFSKIHDGDGDEDEDEENQCSKKKKLSPALADLSFSMDDIKDKYKDARLLPKWKAFQTIIFLERDEGLNDSSKIAAFDFDGCLVNTSVKRVGADAWSLMYPSIPERLRSLYNDGYKLVIFTNESNIGRWTKKRQVAVDSKLGRLNNFIKKVELPIQVFIACGMGKSGGGKVDDPYRKPEPGMWRIMDQCFNSGIPIEMDQSFYVGDAAGRPDDHSDADIGFAKAIGLKFYVPEEYFESN